MLYAHIHPHIAFRVVFYGATSDANISNFLCLKNKSVQISLSRQEFVKDDFSKLKVLKVLYVYRLYILKKVMFVNFSSQRLQKLGLNQNYFISNRNQLAFSKHNLEFYSN